MSSCDEDVKNEQLMLEGETVSFEWSGSDLGQDLLSLKLFKIRC